MERMLRIGLSIALLAGLAGCGGGSGNRITDGGTDPTDPPVGDLTVVASVVSSLGLPVPNMAVVIDGVGPRLTDATGRVQFTQVAAPYDAVVFQATDAAAYVFEGVTRADPMFKVLTFPSEHVLEVEGTVTGGIGFPMPPDHDLEVYGHVEDVGTVFRFGPSPVSGGFASGLVSWWGPRTTRLTLVALQYETNVDGLARLFTGYGLQTITITDGDVATGVDLALEPVGTETISGNVTAPPDYVPIDRSFSVILVGGIRLGLPAGPPDAPTFAYRTPVIPGSRRQLFSALMSPASIYTSASILDIPAPSSDAHLEVPYATECGFPIQGAVGVGYETPFLAGPDEGDRVYTYHFQAMAGGPRILLRTASATVTIPDLTTHGLGLAPGTPCRWKVDGDGPAAALDDLLDPGRVLGTGIVPRVNFNSTMTQWWEFTFDP